MFAKPPDASQDGFLAVLDEVIAAFQGGVPYLGSAIHCQPRPDDAPEKLCMVPRLLFPCAGLQRYAISDCGRRLDLLVGPGQGIYLVPKAWAIDYWDFAGQALGMVLGSECLRLVQAACDGNGSPPRICAYHTALPLRGAGLIAIRALDYLSAQDDGRDGAAEFLLALLRCIRRQLQEDSTARAAKSRAKRTWQSVHAYLEENFGQPVTRAQVASALDLHPNYLSVLSQQIVGQSFKEILEGIRTRHAQRLLRETDLKIDRVARLCGYAKATSLSKAFRRATGLTPGQYRNSRG